MLSQADKLEAILTARPALKSHFTIDRSVTDAARGLIKTLGIRNAVRQKIETHCFSYVRRIFGQSISDQVASYFEKSDVISTADHHGVLSFPLLINSNLFFRMALQSARLPLQLVLASEGVPLNNISYPRGIYYRESRLPFFPNKDERTIVRQQMSAQYDYFKDALNGSHLSSDDQKYLSSSIGSLLASFGKGARFSEQISLINAKIWPSYFNEAGPDMIALPLEEIISAVLADEEIWEHPLLRAILLEDSTRDSVVQEFEGLPGFWNKFQRGTHFFWSVRSDGRSDALWIEDGHLCNSGHQIQLDRHSIMKSLKARQIYPSVFMCYLILTFMGGLVLLGGFNQINLLDLMKRGLLPFCKKLGFQKSFDQITELPIDGLVCGPKLVNVQGFDATLSPIGQEQVFKMGERSYLESLQKSIDQIYSIISPKA